MFSLYYAPTRAPFAPPGGTLFRPIKQRGEQVAAWGSSALSAQPPHQHVERQFRLHLAGLDIEIHLEEVMVYPL